MRPSTWAWLRWGARAHLASMEGARPPACWNWRAKGAGATAMRRARRTRGMSSALPCTRSSARVICATACASSIACVPQWPQAEDPALRRCLAQSNVALLGDRPKR